MSWGCGCCCSAAALDITLDAGGGDYLLQGYIDVAVAAAAAGCVGTVKRKEKVQLVRREICNAGEIQCHSIKEQEMCP